LDENDSWQNFGTMSRRKSKQAIPVTSKVAFLGVVTESSNSYISSSYRRPPSSGIAHIWVIVVGLLKNLSGTYS
jgi:hypothetical protein